MIIIRRPQDRIGHYFDPCLKPIHIAEQIPIRDYSVDLGTCSAFVVGCLLGELRNV